MLEVFSWMMTGLGLGLVAQLRALGRRSRTTRGLAGLSRGPLADQGAARRCLATSARGWTRSSLGGADPRRGPGPAADGLPGAPGAERGRPDATGLGRARATAPTSRSRWRRRWRPAAGCASRAGRSRSRSPPTPSWWRSSPGRSRTSSTRPSIGFRDTVHGLPAALMPTTLRLDTALLFATLKHEATADERGRLAREMHDGVAQEIVYIGYLVDALAADPATPEQGRELAAAEAAHHRRGDRGAQVGAHPAHPGGRQREPGRGDRHPRPAPGRRVRHPDPGHRRRGHHAVAPEVEAELLRIGQEAMNNAVKHSQADQIDVSCRVDPPRGGPDHPRTTDGASRAAAATRTGSPS